MKQNKINNLLCQDELPPDSELLTWEKWVEIRKHEAENLSKRTGKPLVDLTMHTVDEVREDKERKTVLEHAQIEKKATVRETLWDQPQRLKQTCYCKPVYEVMRTKAEKGRPSIIEHIGVPQLIKETEKGLTGTSQLKPCKYLDASYIEYRKQREEELEQRIKKIDPYKPDISNLIIIGHKPITKKKRKPVVPEIKVSTQNEVDPIHAQIEIRALQINQSIIYKEMPGQDMTYFKTIQENINHVDCNSWYYYFNTPVNEVGRAELFLKNLGTVSLRYQWKKININVPFIPDIHTEQVFFFNKNYSVIYPGQEKKIHFTFVSNKPVTHSESWELRFTDIDIFDALDDIYVINLQADTREECDVIKGKANALNNTIKLTVRRKHVISLIDDIVTKAVSVEHQIYPYKHLFVEAEIFEMKNPVCFYYQQRVRKLKELYTEMVPGEIWDLSINSWRTAMMNMECDNRLKYYQLLCDNHKALLKPWFDRENLLEEKYRAVNIVLIQFVDKFFEEDSRLRATVIGLGKRSDTRNVHRYSGTARQSGELTTNVPGPLRSIFYMQMYDHFAETIETCAGLLRSLDLNRWIHFDFCRK